jgi:predicted O-methyltransferase YrrM
MMVPNPAEPRSPEMVTEWARTWNEAEDRFHSVYAESEVHRVQHGPECTVYPTGSGPLLGVLAAALNPGRILELGTGLGYSTLWLAASGAAQVDTVEEDGEHASIARATFSRYTAGAQITVLEGRGSTVLATLDSVYDLAFVDSDPLDYPACFEELVRVLRPGGLLTSSNLFLGQYIDDASTLAASASYRDSLLQDNRLMTAFMPSGLALSVRR